MILIYDETEKLCEMFDTAKEFKKYLSEAVKEINEGIDDTNEKINLNCFEDMLEVFTNGLCYRIKFQ